MPSPEHGAAASHGEYTEGGVGAAERGGEGPVMDLRPVGDLALLVELPGLPEVLSLQAQLQDDPAEGQVDVVAAARTVLVTVREAAQLRALATRLQGLDVSVPVERSSSLVTVEVVYDGEDLAEVAARTGLSEEAVVAAHTSTPWTAAFGGFAPGFAYLTGGDPRLEIQRRDSPRTAVPAGSVALAGMFSAVYPRRSPGGWQLIGRTDAVLWDTDRAEPALIRPGARVQFTAVRDLIDTRPYPQPDGQSKEEQAGQPTRQLDGQLDPQVIGGLTVVAPGLSSTVQDLGRPGLMALGVAGSGALDRASLRQANRLVGNETGAAVIETVFGGLGLRAEQDQVVAVTGADVELVITSAEGREHDIALCAPFLLRGGDVLRQSAPASGLRTYTAVRGGLEPRAVLGSRATDALSGLGPPPLAAGDSLTIGEAAAGRSVGFPEMPRRQRTPELLRIVPGPRGDWFDDRALALLYGSDWSVTAQSNRIGLRLDGPALTRSRTDELPSEGTVPGALQVPPSGLPLLFLADHPVTGGYPVIAVVVSADLDLAAQLPPGATVRFRPEG